MPAMNRDASQSPAGLDASLIARWLADGATPSAGPGAPTPALQQRALATLLALTPQFIWEADAQGRVTHSSAFGRNYMGLSLEQVRGSGWLEAVAPEDRDRIVAAWEQALERGCRYETEFRIRRAVDGQHRWHVVRADPVRDDDGRIDRWVGIALDIHDAREAQAQAERSTQQLQALGDATPGLLYMKDRQGRMVWCNRAVLRALGRQAEEVIGRTDREFLGEGEQARAIEAHDRAVMEGGESLTLEEMLPHPTRTYLSTKTPWRDACGQVIGLVGVSLDITDERRLRQELAARQREIDSIAPVIVSRFDRRLRHVFVSRSVERVTGRPAGDFIGRTNRELGMPAALCEQWDAAMHAVFAQGVQQEIEFSFDAPSGPLVFRSVIAPDEVRDSAVETIMVVAYDVTALRRQEAATRQREAQLGAALQAAGLHTWRLLLAEQVFLVPQDTRAQHAIATADDRVPWEQAFTAIDPADRARVEDAVRRCADGQGDYDQTYRVRDAQGHTRWVRAAGRRVEAGADSPAQLVGVTFDLTQLHEARARLQDQEERLRLAVQAVEAGTYDWDLVQDELRWDARTSELFGLPPGQAPSYDFFLQALHPQDRPVLEQAVARALHDPGFDGVWRQRYRVRQARPGGWRWLDSPGRVYFEGQGAGRRAVRFLGLVTDVSAQVEATQRLADSEQALQRSLAALARHEEQLRLAMESSALGWWDMDVRTRRLVWSDTARRMFDLPQAGEVALEAPVGRIHPEDRARVSRAIEAALEPGADGRYRQVYRVVWRNGSEHWIDAVGQVHFEAQADGSRCAARFAGVLWDVTAQRLAAQERESLISQLQRQQAFLQAVLETVPVGIVTCEAPSGRIVHGNRRAQEIFGHPVHHSADIQAYAEWVSYHEDSRLVEPHEYPAARVILEGAEHAQLKVHYRRGDGRMAWVQLAAAPIRDEGSGRITGAVVVSLDVDAEHHALAALRVADQRKNEFLAMLAHELRNPLAGMSNSMRLLQHEPGLTSRGTRAVEIIARQTHQMRHLIDELLEVSRITRGAVVLKPEPLQLESLLHSVVDAVLPAAQARGQRVSMEMPPAPVCLTGDAVRLSQVMENLLSNAVRYTPEGGRIDVSLQPRDDGGAELRVRDNGIGIAPEKLKSIFDLFVQAAPGVGAHQHGLGIGLAMVRKLVELHGGRVHAESAGAGQGATFVVRLPAAPPGQDTVDAA